MGGRRSSEVPEENFTQGRVDGARRGEILRGGGESRGVQIWGGALVKSAGLVWSVSWPSMDVMRE